MITEVYQHKKIYSASEASGGRKSLAMIVGTQTIQCLLANASFTRPEQLIAVQFAAETFTNGNTAAFEFFVSEQGLSKTQFERCVIYLMSSDFTILPQAFAGAASIEALNLVNGRNNTRHLKSHLPGMDLVAGFDAAHLGAIESLFPSAQLKHCGALTLSLFANHYSLSTADMFLALNGSDMELCARNEKGLLFYNVFKPQSDEDVLYYLLFAMEQFALNPQTIKLALAANAQTSDTVIQSIKKYMKHLHLCAPAPSLQLEGDFAQLPSHIHFQLLNQFLCE